MDRAIQPVKINIRVKNVRKLKNGLLVETPSKDELESLLKEASSSEVLQKYFEVFTPKKRDPQIIIKGVRQGTTGEELIEDLRALNESLRDAVIRADFPIKTRENMHWILSLDSSTFRKVVKEGTLYLGWRRVRVDEFVSVRLCQRCGGLGDTAKFCTIPEVCKNCGVSGHLTGDCPEQGPRCVNCRDYNIKYGTAFTIDHRFSDRQLWSTWKANGNK